MTDKILEMMMQKPRWEYAISKGVDKGIPKHIMRQLLDENFRAQIYLAIKNHQYKVAPPHVAELPKPDGGIRRVYVNEPIDRVVLSVINDLLFELTPEMIHPNCMAYRKGIGCGMVVQQISEVIQNSKKEVIGFKSDLSKYFDSVKIEYIDGAFDKVENKYGKSAVIDLLRDYYHNDWYIDTDGVAKQGYQSLKQGCAVASWLANVVLYHIDEGLTKRAKLYKRYSDDMGVFADNYEECKKYLDDELAKMGMKLNPKKVQYLKKNEWFKFLGFALCGDKISMAKSRLKDLQKTIEQLTFKDRKQSFKQAVNKVNRYLYKGNGEHAWATQVLPIVNVEEDLLIINNFIMDALRSVETKKHRIGGLGFVVDNPEHCVVRGKGRNVKMNRQKTGDTIDGYYSLICMRNAIITRKGVYETLVRML